MKIKLLTLMVGPEGSFSPGSVLDFEENKAKVLVAGGYAVSLEPEPVQEVMPEPEESKPTKKVKPKKGR